MRNKCYQIAGRAARFRTGQRCSRLVSVADPAEGGGVGGSGAQSLSAMELLRVFGRPLATH